MDGIRQLRIARRHLEGGAGTSRGRLRLAARALWWAAFDSDTWPADLRDRANRMLSRLFVAGVMTPAIEAMDSLEVGAYSAAIVALCDAAESASGWPPHQPARR